MTKRFDINEYILSYIIPHLSIFRRTDMSINQFVFLHC